MTQLIFDSRWEGAHGIGRVATEIRERLAVERAALRGPRWPRSPVHPCDPVIRGVELVAKRDAVFYSPGFNAPALAQARAVFTVHDLIHLRVPEEGSELKRRYYEWFVRPAVAKSFKVLTVSEYSKQEILEWSGADEKCVLNVGNGVDERFFSPGSAHNPGYPYFLYVGARKPHKNLERMLSAYAASRAAREICMVLSGKPDATLLSKAAGLGIADRLIFAGLIPDADLPAWYRGAVALVFPSTFEGFGLPPVEAMAAGTPVLASNTTSLPEVVGDAALTVDPYSVEALCNGIDRLAFDETLRLRLAKAGVGRARLHSWEAVASKVNALLAELCATMPA